MPHQKVLKIYIRAAYNSENTVYVMRKIQCIYSLGLHSVPACKFPYKERLVKILPAKEQRLVERK